MIEFIPAAHAQTAAAGGAQDGGMFTFIMFMGFALFLYLMIIRPQRKQQKETQAMLGALAVGDEVITSGGMLGKIAKIKDKYLIIKISDSVEITLEKSWVHSVLPKGTLKDIQKD
ncbi:MAG TPA: preprotein translocase subunit YajC [Pseudomonadales bacterium]|jgi:preprotein translocase subunit YajC